MLEIKPSIAQGWGKGELFPILKQLQDFGIGNQGEVFFVDSNMGSDTPLAGDSWEFPFKKLAYALAVADASISRGAAGWGSRNTVFARGSFTEDLVLLADKTDIIGIGTAGTQAKLIGTHIPADNTYATRMINWELRDDGSTSNFTFAAGGFEFHNCWFRSLANAGTVALTIANPTNVLIQGCEFSGYMVTATTMANGLDINAKKAVGNIITGSNGSRLVPSTDQEY